MAMPRKNLPESKLHDTRSRAAILRRFFEDHPIDPTDPLLAEVEGDVDAYIDALIGEDPSLQEVFTALYSMLRHDEELVRSNKAWLEVVERRNERLEARAEQRRRDMAQLLKDCDLPGIELGIVTLSHTLSQGEVVITNQAALPDECMTTPKTPEPKPDKNKIRARIRADGSIEGAHIGERKLILLVNTK